MKEFDCVIVGGGIGGCACAIYLQRGGYKCAVFDENPGGQTAKAVHIENYPGFEKIRGIELMEKVIEQTKKNKAEFIDERVEKIEKKNGFLINGKWKAKTVVIASGAKHRELEIKGEKELYGKGVSYCAVCDGPVFSDEDVVVIGGGNSGATNAIFLSEFCRKVYLIEFLTELNCSEIYKKELARNKKIEVLKGWKVLEFKGKEELEEIVIEKQGKKKEIKAKGVFIYAGFLPDKKFSKELGLKTDKKGFIVCDEKQKTSVNGIFAAGDVTGKLMQAVWAAAEGAQAGLSVIEYLRGVKK